MDWRMMVVAAAAWSMCSGPAAAQQQQTERELALAREILQLGKTVETMNAMMETMTPAMADQYRAQGMSERNAQRLVELFLEEWAREQNDIIELSASAYAERFTEQQLTDIRDFLASSSGRAWSDAGPELTAAMSRVGMVVGEEVGRRAAERLRQEHSSGGSDRS